MVIESGGRCGAVTHPNTQSCNRWFAFAHVCSHFLSLQLWIICLRYSVCLHLFAFARICLCPPLLHPPGTPLTKEKLTSSPPNSPSSVKHSVSFKGRMPTPKHPPRLKTICANTFRGCLCKRSSLSPSRKIKASEAVRKLLRKLFAQVGFIGVLVVFWVGCLPLRVLFGMKWGWANSGDPAERPKSGSLIGRTLTGVQ